jgi:hypothetical protein
MVLLCEEYRLKNKAAIASSVTEFNTAYKENLCVC